MLGTRSILLAPLVLVACGGEAAPAGAQSPSGSAAGGDTPTVTANAAPTPPTAWPFTPGPTPQEKTEQIDRLAKDPGPIKTNWVPPGRGDRYGHAEGVIIAPYATVKERLEDFVHYKDLAGPKFKSVKVVDKQGAQTDVYFNLPIMKGLVTIWYVTRFSPAKSAPAGDVIEGTFVKGNIKDMHIAFTLRPGADDKSAIMMCDLDLALSIPAPQGPLDEELRDACGDAINSVRRTTSEQH